MTGDHRARGRALYLAVLSHELAAHRGLWIGTVVVFLATALLWPLTTADGYSAETLLRTAAAACAAVTALYAAGLLAVFFAVRRTVFPDTDEGRAFVRGALGSLALAALPALPAIIGAGLLLFI